MILYHFTPMENVDAVQREGLRALPQGTLDGSNILGNSDLSVVYLTDTPTSANTDGEREEFRQGFPAEVIVSKRWLLFHTDQPLARFTIQLPSTDRKLKQYGRWHRFNRHRIDGLLDPDDIFARRAMDTWWLYFGDIPPSKITEFIVEEAIPYRPAPAAAAPDER